MPNQLRLTFPAGSRRVRLIGPATAGGPAVAFHPPPAGEDGPPVAAPVAATKPPPDADDRRIEDLGGRIVAAVEALRTERKRADEQRVGEWRRAAVELGVAIASKLVHDHVTGGEFAVESLVRDMVGQLGDPPTVTVQLNPDDLALLTARLAGRPLLTNGEAALTADPALGRGSCRVEANGQT